MISYLKGKVILKEKKFIILDVNGIGFRVFLAQKAIEKIPKIGQTIEIFTVLYLKKETIELYGLLSVKELEVFEVLDKISGIGPRIALALSSLGSLEEIKRIIETQDKKFIEQTKGIGRKKRQMIILELTGKTKELNKKEPFLKDEAFQALVALGFSQRDVREVLSKIPKDIKETEQRIKQALKFL